MPALKGSFSFSIVKRVLSVLEQKGPTKKTSLAVYCRLNYNGCRKYIEMLKTLGWVDVKQNKWSYVTITELGSEVNERLHQLENLDSNIASGGLPEQVRIDSGHAKIHKQASKVEKASLKGKSKNEINIMLVDDEEDILLTYRSFLSSTGYNVEGFTNPYSALQRVASSKPSHFDLIVLDIRMPGINGLRLYQSVSTMTPTSKFLFVSSLDAAQELVSMLPNVKSEQVLQKPIDKRAFVKAVQSILSR